jgi:hypothetical protein
MAAARRITTEEFKKILIDEIDKVITEEKFKKNTFLPISVNIRTLLTTDSEFYNRIIETIENLSWKIFEYTKVSGADSINIFSVETAICLKRLNFNKNKVIFESQNKYLNDDYLIGIYDSYLKVYLPKKTIRKVIFEKINPIENNDEFFEDKKYTIEVFNSQYPHLKHTIIINNNI